MSKCLANHAFLWQSSAICCRSRRTRLWLFRESLRYHRITRFFRFENRCAYVRIWTRSEIRTSWFVFFRPTKISIIYPHKYNLSKHIVGPKSNKLSKERIDDFFKDSGITLYIYTPYFLTHIVNAGQLFGFLHMQ